MAGQALLRLLLLAFVSTGVVGMHTLGHPTGGAHGTGMAGSSQATVVGGHATVGHVLMSDAVMSNAVMADSVIAESVMAESVMADLASLGLPRGGMVFNPLEVCLAILTAGLLVLIAVMVLVRARRAVLRDGTRRGLALAARGPPLHGLIGLRLADLTVQRR
jgi:hypothetical protein